MIWWSLGAIILAVAVLIVIQNLTEAGAGLNCMLSWRTSVKNRKLKDERSCGELRSQASGRKE